MFSQFIKFGAVGAIGFILDGGLLFLLVWLGVDPYIARAFSFPIAVLATWYLNRIWTFQSAANTDPRKQFRGYLTVQLCGAASNYLCYAFVLSFLALTPLNAILAFSVGSAAGLAINFFGARAFVFDANSTKAEH
jgi:putative flippase GtrA